MTPIQRRIMIVSIIASCLMQMIDTTIAIVALPHMQGSMAATPDQISWVLTSYLVSTAMAIPTTAFFTQRFGRKNLLLVVIAGFSITSMLCGMAQSIEQVVVFRILQGICGAYFMPVAQTVILDYYTLEERPRMMSVWASSAMVGPIIGPLLGGYLTESLSWRWVFYINLPIGLLALIGIWIVPLATKLDLKASFRWQGYIYLAVFIGVLQLLLDRGNLKDWFSSQEIWIETIVAALFFYLFVSHSVLSSKPFLNFAIFRDRNLSISLAITFVGGGLLYATLSLMPPFLQTLLGYPVFTSGLLLAPRGLSFVVALMLYGRISHLMDIRYFLGLGIVLSTFSLWQMQQFDMNVGAGEIVWTGIIQGAGLGFFMGPMPMILFATLAKEFHYEAASLGSLVRNLGSSIGISVVTALMIHWSQINHASLTEHIVPWNPLYRPHSMPSGLGLDTHLGLALLDSEIIKQAGVIAYLNDFRMLMWLNALLIVGVMLIRLKNDKPKPAGAAHSHAAEEAAT